MAYLIDPVSGKLIDTAGLDPATLANMQNVGFRYASPGQPTFAPQNGVGLPPSAADLGGPGLTYAPQVATGAPSLPYSGLQPTFGPRPVPQQPVPGASTGGLSAASPASASPQQLLTTVDPRMGDFVGQGPTPEYGPSAPTGAPALSQTSQQTPPAASRPLSQALAALIGPATTTAAMSVGGLSNPPSPSSQINTTQSQTRAGIDPNAPYSPAAHESFQNLIFAPESGFNPNAKNPLGSASGLGQFTNGTFQDFLNSPANRAPDGNPLYSMADKNNPNAQRTATDWLADSNAQSLTKALGRQPTFGEVAAAHFLGADRVAAFAQNPNANAYTLSKQVAPSDTDAAFSSNGGLLTKNMTAGQALQSAVGHFFERSAGVQYASNTRPNVTSDVSSAGPAAPGDLDAIAQKQGVTIPEPHQGQQLGQGQQPNLSSFLNPANFPIRPTKQDEMLALASGLLSTKPGGGLGEGVQNLLNLRQQYAQNALHAGSTAASLQAMGVRLGIQQQNADTKKIATDYQTSGARYTQGMSAKTNAREAAEIESEGEGAAQNLQSLTNVEATLRANEGVAGPSMAAEMKRWIATRLGMQVGDATPTSVQLGQLLSNAQATGTLGDRMRGLGLRTQREFNTFMSGIPKLDSADPEALTTMYGLLKRENQFKLKMFNDWTQLGPEGQGQLMTQVGGVGNWADQRKLNYYRELGLDPDDTNGGAQPTIGQNSQGQWGVTPLKPLSSFQR